MPRLQVGINIPWYQFAADFGVRAPGVGPGIGLPAWHNVIHDDLTEMHRIGFFAIRLWLLGDGGGYEPTPSRNSDRQWHVGTPSRVTNEFVEDFIFLLRAARNTGLKVLPSLIDFLFCFEGDPTWLPIVKGGRYELINIEGKRRDFLDSVLTPLVERVRREELQEVIYAWELINEPEWCTRVNFPEIRGTAYESSEGLWNGRLRHNFVPLESMRDYIREGCRIINGAGFRSTVGFVSRESPRTGLHGWNDAELGVSLHQFHYRGEMPLLQPHDWSPEFPCIIGEIADVENHKDWPARSLYERLQIIEQKNYPAVFIWPEKPPDPAFRHLSREVKDDVQRFVLGG